MFKTLSLIALGFILSACGGGGTGGVSYTTLSVLGNGDGVARGKNNSGEEALIYSPLVVDVVASANAATGADIANVKISDFPIVSRTGYVQMRKGTGTSNGVTINITTVEDTRTTEAGILFMEASAGYNDITMVTGSKYSSAPVGIHNYFGTQAVTSRNAIAPSETGNFTMSADFSAKTFTYSGASGSVNVSGSGILDTANGRFATSGLTVSSGTSSYGGSMHGLLHGAGATSTSGVFHSSGSSPAYTGGFVGSR